jgi:ABC-type phosphate transport system permease subunit
MRIRHLLASTAAAGLLTGAVLALAPAAGATTDTAPVNFGQHVRQCAQTMGFSGAHNPGMHDGAAGWDGMPCQ